MAGRPSSKKPQLAQFLNTQARVSMRNGKLYWTHTPPEKKYVDDGSIKWRAIWCGGFELDALGKRHYHHLDCIPCHCPPGPQKLLRLTRAREIAQLGTRGSAKSEGTFQFLTDGNVVFDLDTQTPGYDLAHPLDADYTYLNCPDYTFLVLRKNSKDLLNYFKRATRYFEHFGGEMTKEPMGVTFPSGAYGIFDHLADADAYEKYIGAEYTRIVVEEANQIPDEKMYLKIKASCRTSNPNMLPQIVLTYNPGGPGARWLKSRFIMPGGKRLPYGKLYFDPFSGQTRKAIFSSVEDNPYAMASGYDKELDSLRAEDPTLYKQWRLGDFEVQQGQFFPMFREHPLEGEPANACHVVKPHKLPGEWIAAISGDWGYHHPSAFYWHKWSPRKQLHVHRELCVAGMGCKELGTEIALRSLDDLAEMSNPHLNLWLSHDAFHRENEGATEAELIREGIESVLGKDSAFIFDRSEEEKLLDRDVSWKAVESRAAQRRSKTRITIINAGQKRRGNLNLIRDYMRWEQLRSDHMEFKPEIYRNLMLMEGELAASLYMKRCEPKPQEVLPVLQIHYDGDALDPRDRGCEKLVVSIQSMIEKETNKDEMEKQEGDDPVDALAYGVGNFRFHERYVTEDERVRQKIIEIRQKNPQMDTNSLIRNAERVEALKSKKSSNSIVVPGMISGMRHRMARRSSAWRR